MQILWQYIIGVLILYVVLLFWVREQRARRRFEGISSYPLLPFIGNIHQIFGDSKALFRHIAHISKVCENNDSGRFIIWIGPYPLLVVQNPEDVRTITNAFVEKPYIYTFGKIWLGDGLVTAPADRFCLIRRILKGSTWKQNIRKLAGTFSSSVVEEYLVIFNAQAKKLVDNLLLEVGKEPFDIIQKYLAHTTLEAICQTALGVSNISESIVTTEYYVAFNRCLELLVNRGMNAFLHPDFMYKLTPQYQEIKKCVRVLHNVSETVMRQRKHKREKLRKEEMMDKKETTDGEEPKFKAFLDILLDLKEIDPSLTEQQIKSEVDTIILGGQETVASTMFYTLLLLGCKTRVQEKVYKDTRPVAKEDLSEMKYLEAVINETLRMYPPVPGILRYADRDLKIKSFTIPKGTICAINAWGAGRSASLWGQDAALYRPERWLEDQPPGNTASFLAFSYGRRACIGKKYAMAILKTVLAQCVRELEFISKADNMQLKVDIALRPTSGHLIAVRRRY